MTTLNKISFLQIAGGRQLRKEVDALIQSYAADKVITTLSAPELPSNAYLLTGDEGISRAADTANQKSSSIYLSDVIDVSDWGNDDAMNFTIGDGTNQATIKFTKTDIVDNRQTLYDLASAITNAKTTNGDALNLTASYDATNDAFSIYNKTSGENNKIIIGVDDAKSLALINNLNMRQVNQSVTADGVTSSLGTKMAFTSETYAAAAQDLSSKQATYNTAKTAYETTKAALEELTANEDYQYYTKAQSFTTDYPEDPNYIDSYAYNQPSWIPEGVSKYGTTYTTGSSTDPLPADRWYWDKNNNVPAIQSAASTALTNDVDENGDNFFTRLANAQSAYEAANTALINAQSDLNAAKETYDNELASILGNASALEDLNNKQETYDAAQAALEAAQTTLDELETDKDYEYSKDAEAWLADEGQYNSDSQKKSYVRKPWISEAAAYYGTADRIASSAYNQWYFDAISSDYGGQPGIVTQIKTAADARLNTVDEGGKTFSDKLADAQSAYDTANAAYTDAEDELNAAQEAYDNGPTISVSGISGTETNVITYTVNDLLTRLKNKLSTLTEGSGTTLASLQAEVDSLQAKSIKDIVKVPVTITYTNGDPATYSVTFPNDIDTLVPAMDTTIAIPVYNLDNTPVLNASGDQLTISVTGVTNDNVTTYTGVVNGVPSMLDNTKKVETYIPVTTDISGKVFATGTFTLDTLPENYLLDNNELAAISYQQAINEIIVRLAGTDDAIDVLADKVGNQAVQDAIDAAVAALRQTVSENKAEAKQDDAAVIAAIETELAADKAALTEQVEVFNLTSTAQTAFVLVNIPNAAKITVKINGAVYEESTDAFTVNRSSKTVTWTATEAEGGFDLTTGVADKIVIRYYTGDGSSSGGGTTPSGGETTPGYQGV